MAFSPTQRPRAATTAAAPKPAATVSAGRIGDVLDTSSSVTEREHPVPLPPGRTTVALRDVEFTYPGADAPVLHGVSMTAEPGHTTAIIVCHKGSRRW